MLRIKNAEEKISIDGDLREFARADRATIALTDTAHGDAALLFDSNNLYVAFDVRDDSPWQNAGGDLFMRFKTGDTVDLWVGPDNARRMAGENDRRIMFAPEGKGTGVVPVVFHPKATTNHKRVSFRSPSGEVVMDRVEPATNVAVCVRVRQDGYSLEAAVPWTDLGVGPESRRIGLDLSINFSDPAGERNVARIHWGRNGAAIVYDVPSEAKLEPETWGVGIMALPHGRSKGRKPESN